MGQPWQEMLDDTGTGYWLPPATARSAVSASIPLREKDKQKDNEISRTYNTRSTSPAQALESRPLTDMPLLIRTRKEPQLYLTLCDGEVQLLPKPSPTGGSFWYGVRYGGWYGFRNTASGTYLGISNSSSICATERQQSPSEYLTAERDVNGGYILYVFRPCGNLLMPVSVSEENKLLTTGDEGVAWDLFEPKYLQ